MAAITLMTRTPEFSYPQLICVLRHMRIQRDLTHRLMLALEERLASGCDGENTVSHCWTQNELDLMDSAIRCLWVEVMRPL